MNKSGVNEIKRNLLEALKKEKAFWSFEESLINETTISDEFLIAYTLRYLDLKEIDSLYKIYSAKKIKQAWKTLLVPEGEYLYTLNRFLAWYYFDAKKPDAYLKSLYTRHLNKLLPI